VLGDVFFKLDTAPSATSTLVCYYEATGTTAVGTATLSNWERVNIEKMMAIIAYQNQRLDNLDQQVDQRIPERIFNIYTELTDKRITDLQTSAVFTQT